MILYYKKNDEHSYIVKALIKNSISSFKDFSSYNSKDIKSDRVAMIQEVCRHRICYKH